MSTWRELRNKGEEILRNNGIEDASFDAVQLLMFVAGFSKGEYLLKCDEKASALRKNEFFACIDRRVNKEPLQYIIGKWDFYDSDFYVGEGVLIPRPETEELVERCIEIIKDKGYKTVYDLCSGSGCIGLSVAAECPDVHCYLFEFYDRALYYTKKNTDASGLRNVTVVQADVLRESEYGIPDADIIISNPPYIRSDEISSLQSEVRKEPVTALDGGADGLKFYKAITDIWLDRLNAGGCVAVECGEEQSDSIVSLFSGRLYCEHVFDSYGVDRFVIGFDRNGG